MIRKENRGAGICELKHTKKASLSKSTSLSDNDGIWTTMALYKWKMIFKGKLFDFLSWSDDI